MTGARWSGVPPSLAQEVDGLVRRGEHARAATALRDAGCHAHAARLFEQIFEHAQALEAYETAGELVHAVRLAIELADAATMERLVTTAIAQGHGEALLASLGRAGRHGEVARVQLARGDLTAAAASFERAGAFDRAAQCLEESGRARDAGVLLERHLEQDPHDAESAWRLGRILSRYGRHDDGVAFLQRAVRAAADPDAMLGRAAPTMMVSFVQLGYEHAARAVLARWQAAASRMRAREPASSAGDTVPPPESLDAFLRSERAAALAAIQTTPSSAGEASPSNLWEGSKPVGEFDRLWSGDAPATAPQTTAPQTAGPPDDHGLLLAGRYLLGEPLGGGGVGQVFRAYDAFADKPVAVKIFGAQALASDAIQAFAREARAFAALAHPAVAQLVELNMAHGFVVTELVLAPTLEERLRVGGDAGWVTAAARALLDLLAHAHRLGLVHGGLKPTNVFLLAAGVRVVDVGAHRLLALRSTETGGLSSVWPYLAPEQLFGAAASAPADLYAVAAMLYRAFTGHPPFAHAEDDRRRAPALASSLHAGVPAGWDAFLARALAPDASRRFADAAEMAAAIPPVPSGHALPAAVTLDGTRREDTRVGGHSGRYVKGSLVRREDEPGVRFYEGTDLLLDRPVWLVEADEVETLAPLVACAQLRRGVQAVYDMIPDAARVVVARDRVSHVAALDAWRSVPQGLARDLAGVAYALEALHGQGWCLGGFPTERGLGPFGPRLTVAPAPLFVRATPDGTARDWSAFGALVELVFGLDAHDRVDVRARFLAALSDRRVLERKELEPLAVDAAHASWPAFLDAVTQRLVLGASSRVVARLVASVLRG